MDTITNPKDSDSLNTRHIIEKAVDIHKLHAAYLSGKIGHSVINRNNLQIVNTEIHSEIFNTVYGCLTTFNSCWMQDIFDIIVYFNERPFTWFFPSNLVTDNSFEVVLNRVGFVEAESNQLMIRSLQNVENFCPKTKLVMKQVESVTALNDFIEVFGSYDITAGSFYKGLRVEHVNEVEKLFVGYHEDRPVIISSLVESCGICGIFNLLAHSDERRKGFATDLMGWLLKFVQNSGFKYVTLSTESGIAKDLYRRLGFTTLQEKLRCFEFKGSFSGDVKFTAMLQSTDIDFLTRKINEEVPEYGSAETFEFFIRDSDGVIIAGCNGSVVYGNIYTDQLWVHSNYRKKGLGRKLMLKVHTHGLEKGCTFATVSTMNFQNTESFYKKLGYEIEFERLRYVQDSKCIFLKRSLPFQ